MNRKNNVWGKWIYWFVYAVAVITVYKTLDNFSDITNWIKEIFNILMPFIIGIFLAYLFYVPCKNIEKLYKKSKIKIIKNKSRLLSVFTVYLIAIVILIIGINFILPAITTSISDLLNNIDNYYNSTIKEIETFSQDSILRKIDIKKILEELKNINIEQYFNLELLTQYAKGAIGIANGIFDFFVSIAYIIYSPLIGN